MKQQEIFKDAIWVCAAPDYEKVDTSKVPYFPVLRGKFTVSGVKSAKLYVLGLGFFHCYINGKRVGDDLFLPLSSDYEPRRDFPEGEVLSGHRIYVPQYDVTSLLHDGENVISVHFGGGWYAYYAYYTARFGDPKAIWRVFGEGADGEFDFVSSEQDKIGGSFIKDYHFTCYENHDYTEVNEDIFSADFDDSAWDNAKAALPLDTEYLFCDCPPDRVCETLEPTIVSKTENSTVYDSTKNISGYPVLKITAEKGETVKVLFSEELRDGKIDPDRGYEQSISFVSDGTPRTVRPLFTWFGFRYFEVIGKAEPVCVEFVHSDVAVISRFKSDNPLLNWIHDAYLNTQLCNLHAGIPSDCPHIERRGYTGDGQLTCHAAMNMLDMSAFYKKWIRDIADGQDTLTGHIQYTAPYIHSGGGPGGWGCAVVEVPYQYYLHYGDTDILSEVYPNMLKYFEYLEAHSYADLVISDKEGDWCLGDWCPPTEVVLPAPFVNNYFYIKSLMRAVEIAKVIGKEGDIPLFESRIAERKSATLACYFNSWDGNFLGNLQGANAFAVDIGLGDERTYQNLVKYYKKLGRFDTGIFGTDIVTRVLFERGDGQVAVDLLLSEDRISFDGMRKEGATTLWEYWPDSLDDRSRNHPMFGAVAAYLYDYLLGIKTNGGSIKISPVFVDGVNSVSGERTLMCGKVAVSYEKGADGVSVFISIPQGQKAEFVYDSKTYPLKEGENRFRV